MSTAPATAPAADLAPLDVKRPNAGTLVAVELRKSVDTLTGRWLLGVTVALVVGALALVPGCVDEAQWSLTTFAAYAALPLSLLLPVLGQLLVALLVFVLVGVGFGLLAQNTPLAVVAYLLLPSVARAARRAVVGRRGLLGRPRHRVVTAARVRGDGCRSVGQGRHGHRAVGRSAVPPGLGEAVPSRERLIRT